MDVRPDMLTCAKALSSAYLPISAILMSDRVYDTLAGRLKASAFSVMATPIRRIRSVPLSALRAQQLMQERDIVGHVRSLAPLFAERVARMDRFDFIGNTRAIGLIGAMEFSSDPRNEVEIRPGHKIAAQAVAKIQDHGVILRALPGDIIGFVPPLVISEAEMNDMFDRIDTRHGRLRRDRGHESLTPRGT